MAESVSGAAPELLRVTVCDALVVFRATFPNGSVLGVSVRTGRMMVPAMETDWAASGDPKLTLNAAALLTGDATLGRKLRLALQLDPIASDAGAIGQVLVEPN